MGNGSINPRVVAWARTRGIDPTQLVRPLGEDRYLIDGCPWTVYFSEWIQEKWREWRKLCTHKPTAKDPLCDHCHNHEKFDAWLQETTP